MKSLLSSEQETIRRTDEQRRKGLINTLESELSVYKYLRRDQNRINFRMFLCERLRAEIYCCQEKWAIVNHWVIVVVGRNGRAILRKGEIFGTASDRLS